MQELRALCFEPLEVARAVVPYLQGRHEEIPRGTIDEVTISSQPEFSFTLTIVDDYGVRHSRSVDEATCAAALIAFCLDRRVPLPAHAEKRFEAVGDQVVLTFRVEDPPAKVRRLGVRAPTRGGAVAAR